MIQVKNLRKRFDELEVLSNINALFIPGECNLILGQSGAGKTVLMKCLIGVLKPTSGEILFDNIDMATIGKKQLKLFRTRMGVLFQGSALFDSMSVYENVLFPLEMFSKKTPVQRRKKADELIERVGLTKAKSLRPSEISGGMMKRCAIARSLVLEPDYLFCDEPNSGLDPQTSQSIDELLYSLTHENNITTVINTHDMNSVSHIGDTILYLNKGEVEWSGTMHNIETDAPESFKRFISAK